MEEILASIRRIIADDDANKAAKPAPTAAAKPVAVAAVAGESAKPAPRATINAHDEIEAMLADLESATAPPSDVLNLTEDMAAPVPVMEPTPPPDVGALDASADDASTADAFTEVAFTERSPPAPLERPAGMLEEPRRPIPQPGALDRGLISNATVAAVDSAFNTLAYTVIGQNARTLEDLVKEMLRPMLKSWLDDNLPGLVDRIVRAEIERVSRGR
jgi:cell pole-organizing protein PopZ